MAGGDLGADAVLALGHHGVAEGHHVHALFQHPLGELMSGPGIGEHDGDNGVLPGQQVEAQLLHLGAEVPGVFVDLVPQLRGGGEQLQGFQRGGADGRSQGVGEEVGPAALAQQVHDLLPGGGVAAGGPAQGLAEGTGEDVHPALDAAELRSAPALVPHEAHGVAVVHHHQGVKLIGQIADPLEVGDVAVHGEHAVGSDELHLAAGGLGVLQAPAQVRHVVVLVAVALGLAQPHAVDDGRVVQLVGDHRVLGPQQGLEETAVGVEAGGVENGVVHAQKLRQLPLQLLVDGLGAADKPHGAQAEAPPVIALLGRLDEGRVVAEPQVVVGAHVHHPLGLGGVDAGELGCGDHPLLPPGPRLPDGLQLSAVLLNSLLHIRIPPALFLVKFGSSKTELRCGVRRPHPPPLPRRGRSGLRA